LFNHWSQEKLLEKVKEYADRELTASEIIGRTIISERFAEKMRSIVYKYHSLPQDLRLLLDTAILLYNDKIRGMKSLTSS
jgi:hypothetical protein